MAGPHAVKIFWGGGGGGGGLNVALACAGPYTVLICTRVTNHQFRCAVKQFNIEKWTD